MLIREYHGDLGYESVYKFQSLLQHTSFIFIEYKL